MFRIPPLSISWTRGRTALAAAALVLVLGACQGSQGGSADAGTAESPNPAPAERAADGRRAAPEFALANLEGETVRLSDFEGQVVLVDFWATWCGPCRAEIPHLKELYSRYREKGFALVGISLDQAGPNVVKSFVDKNELPYPIVMGDEQTARDYGGVTAIPTAFLIDRDGNVVKKYVGYKPFEVFVADIEPLL